MHDLVGGGFGDIALSGWSDWTVESEDRHVPWYVAQSVKKRRRVASSNERVGGSASTALSASSSSGKQVRPMERRSDANVPDQNCWAVSMR